MLASHWGGWARRFFVSLFAATAPFVNISLFLPFFTGPPQILPSPRHFKGSSLVSPSTTAMGRPIPTVTLVPLASSSDRQPPGWEGPLDERAPRIAWPLGWLLGPLMGRPSDWRAPWMGHGRIL